MSAFARRIVLSWGWERRCIACLAGAFGVLALQPFGLTPAFFVPMTLSVWLLDGCVAKKDHQTAKVSFGDLLQAADVGWWLGFGYFVAGMWWVGDALLVDPGDFAWAIPLAVLGLPALLAAFTALGFAVARLFWSGGLSRIFALSAGLGFSDWLRGHAFSGFPWNAFAMPLANRPILEQGASIFGLYGLSIIAVFLFASPALFSLQAQRVDAKWNLAGAFLAVGFGWTSVFGFGAWRLRNPTVGYVPGVRLRIMQPDLVQDQKFRPENGEKILARYLKLSDRATSPYTPGISDVTDLIWPESAFPFILSRSPQALAMISNALPPGVTLITGAARAEPATDPQKTKFFNSIQVVSSKGMILDTYDKIHLVPFGEYLPFQSLLEKLGLQDVVRLPGGFSPGRRRKLLEARGLPPILPMICYEAIFPIESGYDAPPGVRPGLILNVTNDGWFGRSIGPYQHFAQARMRAVEEGLPLVRAANTGISAVVDPYGRVWRELPLGVADVLDSRLPQSIGKPWFAEHPILSPLVVWLLALAGAMFRPRKVKG